MANKKPIVYLIGAGPGEPGLFTLKGKKILEKAEVIVYDRLVSESILALGNPKAEYIYVGKMAGKHALSQDKINNLLVKKVSQGKIVARLKGGDPFLFGRGGEEALYIRQNGYDYEIVPGISSAIAVPAYAGIPVTHRDITSSLAIITGHEMPNKHTSSIKWKELAQGVGTLVFLMGLENLDYICKQLMSNGKNADTPVALIRWGTLPIQETLIGTLGDIRIKAEENAFKPPAVIIVGDVVRLRPDLKWFENKPLWGKRIFVTRARAQVSRMVEAINDLGGEAIEFPSIVIKEEENLTGLYNAFMHLDSYNWIIFTSVNTVQIFFNEMKNQGIDIRALHGIKLCAIGPATRDSLQSYGLVIDLIPEEYQAEGIIAALKGKVKMGQWVLLPRARGARKVLPETLRQWGLHVNEVILYEALPADDQPQAKINEILDDKVDYLTFTSSSTVKNFVRMVGKDNLLRIQNKVKVACIGPITAETARSYGFKVDILAKQYTIDGLLKALIDDSMSV
ncbi:MAG: uroporphyrinogen-III C-methyltransferase [Syntrophomonadaceae bacterium]|jgi:uroporphyrinogen III methyltransferase/synthase